MVEITYQLFLSTLQTVGILVGIVYYITIMRNAQRTRELALKAQEEAERSRKREMILQRLQSFDLPFAKAWGDVMFKDPEKWSEVYNPRVNLETYANMVFLQNRYQNLGIMVREKVVDPELLFQIFNPMSIISAWEHYRENIESRRKSGNQPSLFDAFEYLAEEARKRYPHMKIGRPRWGYETE